MKIAGTDIGPGHPCFVISEIGVNHQGSMDIAQRLQAVAKAAGCDAVKYQKRTVDVVYTPEELAQPRPGPWGPDNGSLKRLLEFSKERCGELMDLAEQEGMSWSASPWDIGSVQTLADLGVSWIKIASASIADLELVSECCSIGCPVIMSTGMSTTAEIDAAVEVATSRAPSLALLHTCSAYPSEVGDLHLSRMEWMRDRYGCVVGYSGHERGVATSVEAVRLGASIVERHITLDRSMWGSDQAASLEPAGLRLMVSAIRALEALPDDVRAMGPLVTAAVVECVERGDTTERLVRNLRHFVEAYGTPGPREVLASEEGPRKKLRKA